MTIRHACLRSTATRAVLTAFTVSACGSVAASGGGLPDAAEGMLEPIHFVGRFDLRDPTAPVFEWSGSAIWTRFSGTTISAELDGPANDFEIEVDGMRRPVLVHPGDDHTYVLASALSAGEHDVKLTRRTEAFYGATTFRGFTGATPITTPRSTRLIEMIGDSITCGYGITGVGPSCGFSHDTEAETYAYGALAAAQLGATHHAICWSGIGVSRNYNDEAGMLMPERYGLITPNEESGAWDFSQTPQAVVINLGNNDFSMDVDPGQHYVNAMIAFVAQIRGHYPSAPIVLTTSPMLNTTAEHTAQRAYLETAAASDPHTTVLDFAQQDEADGYGCDYHPSEITAQKMADKLKLHLHTLLGW